MNTKQLNELMNLLRLVGGKFVLVEDGEPRAVLMDYKEFEELVEPYAIEKLSRKAEEIERFNREITAAQHEDLREEVIESEVTVEERGDKETEIDDDYMIKSLDFLNRPPTSGLT